MSNQNFLGAGASVPVPQKSLETVANAAVIVGVSAWTYSDQSKALNKYDKALGIDVNLPKDVRKRLRDEAFRAQGERPPVSAGRSVVYLWVAVFVALFAIYAIAALILAAV